VNAARIHAIYRKDLRGMRFLDRAWTLGVDSLASESNEMTHGPGHFSAACS
jgi:hypothetical protein